MVYLVCSGFNTVCSVFNLNNKIVKALIARELSGFTCTSSQTTNSKFSCGIEISRLFKYRSDPRNYEYY